MENLIEDAELKDAPTDKLELAQWVTKRLGRRPTLSEMNAISAQIARSQSKKAQPKAAPAPKKGRGEPKPGEITREIVGSQEGRLGLQLLLAGMTILFDLADHVRSSLSPQRKAPRRARHSADEQYQLIRRETPGKA